MTAARQVSVWLCEDTESVNVSADEGSSLVTMALPENYSSKDIESIIEQMREPTYMRSPTSSDVAVGERTVTLDPVDPDYRTDVVVSVDGVTLGTAQRDTLIALRDDLELLRHTCRHQEGTH